MGVGRTMKMCLFFLVREGCFGWLDVKFSGFSWQFNGHFILEMNAKSGQMKAKCKEIQCNLVKI